jgi:hypothetical protein
LGGGGGFLLLFFYLCGAGDDVEFVV